ncbi:immunoglobulin domain-containing protein [uncultured Cytophaga sp.]|uniref:immunoglobulin domain-containing protein n=1 Tax=uncultured Cytophaga sp. TaxID=160238 RepID=UPI0026231379|nr:immunoglobulin domain-containing protein [uncultured Cytophaga sp.]
MKQLYFKLLTFVIASICFQHIGEAQTWKYTVPTVGAGYVQAMDVATDVSDNVYTVGSYYDQITSPVSIFGELASNGYVIKTDPTGTEVFSLNINGNSVIGKRVALDASGNVFVSGSLSGSAVYFDGFKAEGSLGGPSSTLYDGFIAKYSSTGTLMWIQAIGSKTADDQILDMTLDANGDILVTGYIGGDAKVYGKNYGGIQGNRGDIFSQGGATNFLDVVVAKFGNDGTFKWGFSLGSVMGSEKGTAITTDASNNVYVSGLMFNTVDFDPDLVSSTSSLTGSTPGNGDAFIAKYDKDGSYLNVGQISGAGLEQINRMHIGTSGVLNVAGTFTGFIDADPRSGNVQNITAAGTGKDILFASYNLSTLAPVFAQRIGANNVDDEALGIKVNASGDIYLTGYFSGSSVNFNPLGTALNLTSIGGTDVFISKYNASGINQWGFKAGSTSDDQGNAMAFNASSMIYACGSYKGAFGDLDPGAGTSTLAAPVSQDSYLSKYQECSATPVIVTQPLSKSLCAGATLNLSTVATGSGISYKWKNGSTTLVDGGTISGATTPNLIITSTLASDAGTYTCIASSCGNSVTSSGAIVQINTAPAIVTQPVAQSICAGANTSFTILVTGTLPLYQWKLNGVAISNNAVYAGTQAATLNIIAPTALQAGNYSCTVTGSCAPGITSTAVALTISSGIIITAQPIATAACLGGAASFSVMATGTSLTYQWQKNNVDLVNGGTISGAKTASLSISSVVAGDATNYKCIITSSCGNVTTTAVVLTLTNAPAISTQPTATQTICAGQNASFSVIATGASSYQWKKGGTNLVNGGNVSGATASTLQLTTVSATDAALYTCVITGACAPTVTTTNATLVVNDLPVITTQPTPITICQGLNTTYKVVATGTNLIYKWQRNNVDLVDGGGVLGATTNTLSISGVTNANAGNYTCIVSGACSPSVTSSIASLTVNSTASIATNPTDKISCVGQTTTFTLGTTGSGITYQWKKGGTNLVDGGNVSGVTTSVLSITNTALADAAQYSCSITNSCSGTLNSTSATLTVNTVPTITSQPTDVTICGSAPVSFSVTATGTGITYQWKKGGTNLSNGGGISGVTTSSLSIALASGADAGAYTCVVSGTCSPAVTSSIANLAVGSLATIITQPISKALCSGIATTFNIVVSGTGISYQWKKDGVALTNTGNVSGATTATLNLASITSADAASYTCETGNTCSGFLTSDPAILTINTKPTISTQPVSKSICVGAAASFSVVASGSGIAYQWKKDGAILSDGGEITGCQTTMLSLSSTTAADAGVYVCEVSGTCTPVAISTGATLSLAAGSTIVSQPVSKIICSGNSTVFTCSATGGSLTYQWKKDGTALVDGPVVSGAATFSVTLTGVSIADAGSYICEVSSTCSAALTSNVATLTVNSSTSITAQPSPVIGCEGISASFSITASGSGITYQWKKDGSAISAATNATYNIAAIASVDAGSYICDVISACGVLPSAAALLTVNSPATITTQPIDINACPGDNATLTVVAAGSNLTFKWFKNSVALIDGGNISDATTNALTIASVAASDEDTYSVEITALCGTPITSTSAVLSLSTTPTITTQPQNTLICTGQPLVLNIVVSSAGTTLYQWKKDGADIVDNGTTINGATSATLTISNTTATTEGAYTCSVSTICSAATLSNAALVTTTTSTPISKQPITSSVCRTQPVLFTVEIAGSGLMYQWQFKPNGSSVYANILDAGKYSGTATHDLVVTDVDVSEEGAYRCIITELCGAVQNSAPAALIINSPTIVQHPFPQSVCLGQLIQFNVVVTGNSLVYQWSKDGLVLTNGGRISGAASSSLKITGSTVSDNGDYTCTVKGICTPDAVSQPGTLTVTVCTGISGADLNGQMITLYPKPANQSTTIEISNQQNSVATISLFDVQGSLVQEIETRIETDSEKISFETAPFPQGMYFMHIRIGNQLFIDKLEIIH